MPHALRSRSTCRPVGVSPSTPKRLPRFGSRNRTSFDLSGRSPLSGSRSSWARCCIGSWCLARMVVPNATFVDGTRHQANGAPAACDQPPIQHGRRFRTSRLPVAGHRLSSCLTRFQCAIMRGVSGVDAGGVPAFWLTRYTFRPAVLDPGDLGLAGLDGEGRGSRASVGCCEPTVAGGFEQWSSRSYSGAPSSNSANIFGHRSVICAARVSACPWVVPRARWKPN